MSRADIHRLLNINDDIGVLLYSLLRMEDNAHLLPQIERERTLRRLAEKAETLAEAAREFAATPTSASGDRT